MQQRHFIQTLPSRAAQRGCDLDARLALGPLRVQSLWSDAQTQRLAKRVRSQRRRRLLAHLLLLGAASLALSGLVFTQLR